MDKKKSDEPNRKAIYVGRRLSPEGKVFHKFLLLPKRTDMHFASTRGAWIGYTYTCWATQMLKKPVRTDDDHIQDASWEAEDAAVESELLRRRHLRKLEKKSHYQMERCVEQLRPLVKGLRYLELKALMDLLVRKAQQKV